MTLTSFKTTGENQPSVKKKKGLKRRDMSMRQNIFSLLGILYNRK